MTKNLLLLISLATFIVVGAMGCGGIGSSRVTEILLGEKIKVSGSGATVSERGVVITAGGTYRLSGTLANGLVEIAADGQAVELVLAGATIHGVDGPAIFASKAGSLLLTLDAGTSNALSDSGKGDRKAVIYSNASITMRGSGQLQVNGARKEGISSAKNITIEGGDIRVQALEDGLNASSDGISQINIKGGNLHVESTRGDAIDSNGTIAITGGTVTALGSLRDESNGLDTVQGFTIDGGTVIATGLKASIPSTASKQHSLLVTFGTAQAADTLLALQRDGAWALAYAPTIGYATLLVSTPSIADGATYDVYIGGTATGTVANGIYNAPQVAGGTLVASITAASAKTTP